MGGNASTSKVWERNVKLLENMELKFSRDGVEKAMKGETIDGMVLIDNMSETYYHEICYCFLLIFIVLINNTHKFYTTECTISDLVFNAL